MSALSALPNVGRVLDNLLNEAGITSPEQLREIGAQEAFLRVKLIDPSACIHMLYGIQGAIEGIKDKDLAENTKRALKEFFRSL